MSFEFLRELERWQIFLIILDIGLISFLFYYILLLLNRTRALRLLVVVVLLLLVDVLARYLQLKTLAWLITNVSSYLVIGLIVLMQPELRRLLANLTQSGVFQWLHSKQGVPISEIVKATRNMAANRIGSIIVILGNIELPEIIEQAVVLNSELSSELIETIFFKDSPLHDGAVIIKENKIIAASCYLPLSGSRKLKKTQGARYRAALGMSEETDAVIVVTSEESGKVFVLHNGNSYEPKLIELENCISNLLLNKPN